VENRNKLKKWIENDLLLFLDRTKNLFSGTLKAVILYGSWAKRTAKKDSDIDLLLVFSNINDVIKREVRELATKINTSHTLDIVTTTIEDFEKEKNPLYTAVKKEGKIIFGKCDMKIINVEPRIKYKEFFFRSKNFETNKIKMVEKIKKEYSSYSGIELCWFASKHAIQTCLAMKGCGYSSKFKVLYPLCKKHFGKNIADAFKKLFHLYIKSEYTAEIPSKEESNLALSLAKEIIKVYNIIEKELKLSN